MTSTMPPRPLALSAAHAAALVLVSLSAAASPPAVPPVAEIPVAPAPRASRRAGASSGKSATATLTTTTTTTTTTVPSLAAVTVDPGANAALPGAPGEAESRAHGAAETMPFLPAPEGSAAAHPVLADELPFRAERIHKEATEHPRHGRRKGRHGRPYHPAPGIVVDVLDATGGASAAELQRTARSSGYWPFRHCYEEGLRRDQHLAGHVALDLPLSQAAADRATVTNASLHDESVVLCVAREAAHLSLGGGADSAGTARLDIALSTGDEPVPVQHAVPHADELRDALRMSWPGVRQCYASALARQPDAGGRLELKFRVHGSGESAEVDEADSHFPDAEVTRCVLGVYRGAKLPSVAHGSHDATFVYALHLEPRPASLRERGPRPESRAQNASPAAK
jgi:hypothetical protein